MPQPKTQSKAVYRAKRLMKDVALGRILPAVYAQAAKEPVDDQAALFVSRYATEIGGNLACVSDCLREQHGMRTEFVSLDFNGVGTVQYLDNCKAMLRKAATSAYVFIDDASDVLSCIDLRPETKVIQLWHACGAFKRFGFSTAEAGFGESREDKRRHPFYGNLSLVTVSSPEVVWAYEEAMGLQDAPGIVRPLGVCRTDCFFDAQFVSASRTRFDQAFPQAKGKRVVLYAPTYRGDSSHAKAPDGLDLAVLKDRLGDSCVLCIAQHPFVVQSPVLPRELEGFVVDAQTAPLSIAELLCAADVCVSDYSSVVYEYALLGRPMAFFPYDYSDYYDWRGFYYDYDELTPGPVYSDTAELADYLLHVDERFDPAQVASFRERFMIACDGNSTERIVEAVLNAS